MQKRLILCMHVPPSHLLYVPKILNEGTQQNNHSLHIFEPKKFFRSSTAIFEFIKVELLSKDSVLFNNITGKSLTIWTFYGKWTYVLKYISYMNWFGFESFFQSRVIHYVLCSKYTMFWALLWFNWKCEGIPIVQGP